MHQKLLPIETKRHTSENHELHIFRNKLTIAFESVRLKVAVFLL